MEVLKIKQNTHRHSKHTRAEIKLVQFQGDVKEQNGQSCLIKNMAACLFCFSQTI